MPVEIKELQAGYLHSSYLKDLYLYLSHNKLPSSKTAIERVETLAERYILLDSLLFKINPAKETAVLAVPEACTDKIITLYHSSLFTGHQGVIKTHLTICDKFFIPNLIHYLRKPKVLMNLESNPDIKVSRTFKEYYELLNKRIKYLQDIFFNLSQNYWPLSTRTEVSFSIKVEI